MSLSNLGMFQAFDYENFFKGKALMFLKAEPWVSKTYEDNKLVAGSEKLEGAVVSVMIYQDLTDYGKSDKTNAMQQFDIKVKGQMADSFSAEKGFKPLQTQVQITDVQKAVIWGKGNFKDELSIEANVTIVERKQAN